MEINTSVIKKVIEKDDIFVEFQPIVSINSRSMVGVESLSRGVFLGETISPFHLFQFAKDLGMTVELDRMCREKSLEIFSDDPVVSMLFLNFEADVLEEVESGTDVILCTTDKYNVPRENIVIEINEKHIYNDEKFNDFVRYYHSKGFLIAIDDVGAGHSNLNRISKVRPDVVKIDRALIQEIDNSPLSQEVIKSIVNISKKVGAFTVAEGIETIDEAITCMLCGVDFFQGYFFSKPKAFMDLVKTNLNDKFDEITYQLNENVKIKQEIINRYKNKYIGIISEIIASLSGVSSNRYQEIIFDYVKSNSEIECIFLLDINGIQISDTAILEETLNARRSLLYSPSSKGDKHDIKNYYYAIKENIEDPFISDWYISNATGNSCKTLSSQFKDKNGKTIIVCIDLKYNK